MRYFYENPYALHKDFLFFRGEMTALLFICAGGASLLTQMAYRPLGGSLSPLIRTVFMERCLNFRLQLCKYRG